MKPQYERRTHLSDENYLKINAIRRKYEAQFRMAISYLFSLGYNTFEKITENDIENDYKKNLEKNDKQSMMTPAFCRDLNYCTLELSKLEHLVLLKYIANYLFLDAR